VIHAFRPKLGLNSALRSPKSNTKLPYVFSLVFIAPLLWYLYWICYDVFVWNKPLVEVNFVNYFGLILSLTAISAGFLIRKKGNKETKRVQQASSRIDMCSHYFGYLSQRPKTEEIPTECVTCERVIACLSKKVEPP